MARISRKELKKDELVTEVSKTYEYLQQQRARLLRVGVASALVLLVALGSYLFLQHRRSRANEELAHAIRVFYVPTTAETQIAEPDMKFADEKARYTQAEKEFAAVAGKYSWFSAGRLARYYLGITKHHLGKTEEAVRELRAVGENKDPKVAALARFALAGVYADTGKMAEAEKLYRELANQPSETVPKETALLALAERLSVPKPAEAEKVYQEILKQADKDSSARRVAEERLAQLKQPAEPNKK